MKQQNNNNNNNEQSGEADGFFPDTKEFSVN